MPKGDDEIGRALREARENAGLTVRAAGKALGVSHAFLSNVERGLYAPLTRERTLEAAKLYKVPASTLLRVRAGWTGEMPLPRTGELIRDRQAAILSAHWEDLDDDTVASIARLLKKAGVS